MDAVGPYRIIAKLGEGGMGEVHLAEDTRLERRVAIKWLRDPLITGPEALHRVRAEARAAARLTHPNIAAVYDVIDTPTGPAIVMEYVDGASLLTRLSSAPLPIADVLAIGAQLAGALAAAHDQHVIHRDLKPANVCVTANGTVKILDFGLARVRGTGTTGVQTTRGGPMIGTPGYCAPEQWLSGAADVRSDLFSLGVVLFELCTRVRPFGGMYATAAAPRADRLNPDVPASLAALIDRLLQIDPGRRPASAQEVHAELAALAGAAAEPVMQAQPRKVSRIAVGLVAAALIAAAGTPFLLRSRADASGAPVVAVLPFHADDSAAAVAAGLDQSLASDLALMPGLVTVNREAVAQYRGEHEALDRIASAVGARYLVDGNVRQAGGEWLLDVRLAHADRDDPVWRRQYATGADGLLAVRERISDDLAAALGSDAGLPRPARRRPTESAEAFTHYSQAVTFLDRRDIPGNVDRAIRLFQSAVEKDGRFALAHAGLAQAYWEKYVQMRDPDMPRLAERAILDAVTLDPDHPQVRLIAARIFNGTGRRERAIEQLQEIVSRHPHDAAYRLLGQITATSGDVDKGLAYVDRAIALRPTYWENYGARGAVCFHFGRFEEARSAFERVVELQPDSAWGYQFLGASYQSLGNDEAALTYYRRSLELAETPGTLSNIATIHYQRERYADAARAYERAAELRPNEAVIQRNLGDTYAHLGDRAKARAAFTRALALTEKVLDVNPADARTTAAAAVLEAKLGRHAAAQRRIARAAAAAPVDPDVHYRRAVVLALGGRHEDAVEAIRHAIGHGYPKAVVRQDDDLHALHARADFQAVVTEED